VRKKRPHVTCTKASSVAQAIGFEVDDLATVKEGDASASDMRGLDQAVHCRIDLSGRKVCPRQGE